MMQIIQKAEKFKGRIAIISDNKKYTYKQLLDASASVTAHLLNEKDDLSAIRITFNILTISKL